MSVKPIYLYIEGCRGLLCPERQGCWPYHITLFGLESQTRHVVSGGFSDSPRWLPLPGRQRHAFQNQQCPGLASFEYCMLLLHSITGYSSPGKPNTRGEHPACTSPAPKAPREHMCA